MYALVLVVHILASIFLVAVILLQAGRGSGLGEGIAGGAMQNIFGSSSQTVLTKATTVCAVIFITTSLLLTILTSRSEKSLIDLNRQKVAGVVRTQKAKTTAKQPEVNKTVTVREVKIDPQTGKEIIVKEEKMTPQQAAQQQAEPAQPTLSPTAEQAQAATDAPAGN